MAVVGVHYMFDQVLLCFKSAEAHSALADKRIATMWVSDAAMW
jgi:hypothetical protein